MVISETIVGGVTFGAVAGGAEIVSLGAGIVGGAVNLAAGRPGNAAADLVGVGFGAAAGTAAHAIHPGAQLARNASAELLSAGASSICPG